MSDDATMTYAASSPPTESHKGRPVVYVYGLTPRVLERHLDEIFGFYGPIKRLRLFPHERPSAMIEFEQEDSVELALSHMDQGQIDGAHVTVSIDPRPDLEEAPLHSPAPWKERKLGQAPEPVDGATWQHFPPLELQ
ncbi:rna-binding protein with serine-rich domain 1-like protein [Malassezia pachydermatis]|uniref:Rna-binding protein with serine-rich domain 1-like protein n=1 Tax=Malassezia pachydermatis TaxID=77020 RepID=A0A0M8MVL4_9BASI|nr:rna-binding protein with serine-rich domain 1-like protein [Malassezia pachydermatis]KOS14670.1 rna-binding protein with serine-rich domain 1-like protein [Malassezia pachydermatis]